MEAFHALLELGEKPQNEADRERDRRMVQSGVFHQIKKQNVDIAKMESELQNQKNEIVRLKAELMAANENVEKQSLDTLPSDPDQAEQTAVDAMQYLSKYIASLRQKEVQLLKMGKELQSVKYIAEQHARQIENKWNPECLLCFDRLAATAYVPCGCAMTCKVCILTQESLGKKKCPFCSKETTGHMDITLQCGH